MLTPVHSCVLPNGLKVVHLETRDTVVFEVSLHIDTGSRDETPGTNGISHFLEHMMFRGAGDFESSFALSEAMEELGGESNAMTTVENTQYWIRGSVRKLQEGLSIFADFMLRPRFLHLETERNIVLQELYSDYNENKDLICSESLAMAELFKTHPLGMPIIGREEIIRRFDISHLKEKRRLFYTPIRSVLTLHAPVPWEQVKKQVETLFGQPWAHCVGPAGLRVHAPDPKSTLHRPLRSCVLQENADNQFNVKLMFRSAPLTELASVAQSFLQKWLDDGIASRLQASIREEHGLAYDLSVEQNSLSDTGTFAIEATVSEDAVSQLLQRLGEQLERVQREVPSEREMERVRFRYLFDLEQMPEQPNRRLSREASEKLMPGMISFNDEKQAVEKMDAAGMRATARQLLGEAPATLVVVGPRARKLKKSAEGLFAALQNT